MFIFKKSNFRTILLSGFSVVFLVGLFFYSRDYTKTPSAVIEGRRIMDVLPFFSRDKKVEIRRSYCPIAVDAIEGMSIAMIKRMINGQFDNAENTIEFFDAAAAQIRLKPRYQDLSDKEIMAVVDTDWEFIYRASVGLSNWYLRQANQASEEKFQKNLNELNFRCVYQF